MPRPPFRLRVALLTIPAFVLLSALAVSRGAPVSGANGYTERVSVTASGAQAIGGSGLYDDGVAISSDGRYVAFATHANNLVPQGINGVVQIVLRDRNTGAMELVSVNSAGEHGNRPSVEPSISADGRYVVFKSESTNLGVANPQNYPNVYLRDRVLRTTTWIAQGYEPKLSANGRFIAFNAFAAAGGLLVIDLVTGTAEEAAVPPAGTGPFGARSHPSISADGRFVAFLACPAGVRDGFYCRRVFVRDRQTQQTEAISVDLTGAVRGDNASPHVSDDGRFVVFMSSAGNLVPGDTIQTSAVFLRDRRAGVTERVSVSNSGVPFATRSYHPRISGDGRHIAFVTYTTNLSASRPDPHAQVVVRDRITKTNEVASVNNAGEVGNEGGPGYYGVAISGNGRFVAFASPATNLVPNDTNEAWDVFVRDRSCSRNCTTVTVTATAPTSTQCARGCPTVTHTPVITATACSRGCTTNASPNGSTTSSPAAGR
jgi:Tol biopolymer transport system component